MSELIKDFSKKHPGVSYDIFKATADLVKEQMDKGLIDIGLLLEPVSWFGAGMLVLFLAHNILNFKWYRNLLKGKHGIACVLQMLINFGM